MGFPCFLSVGVDDNITVIGRVCIEKTSTSSIGNYIFVRRRFRYYHKNHFITDQAFTNVSNLKANIFLGTSLKYTVFICILALIKTMSFIVINVFCQRGMFFGIMTDRHLLDTIAMNQLEPIYSASVRDGFLDNVLGIFKCKSTSNLCIRCLITRIMGTPTIILIVGDPHIENGVVTLLRRCLCEHTQSSKIRFWLVCCFQTEFLRHSTCEALPGWLSLRRVHIQPPPCGRCSRYCRQRMYSSYQVRRRHHP